VTVVGDFNDWNATLTPLRRTPSSAAWIADVHVAPGRYGYAFVVDGHQWITDPTAPLAPDAFGHPTSVLVVGANGAA
jgi:1,4-alpha-glucan branching enzyme